VFTIADILLLQHRSDCVLSAVHRIVQLALGLHGPLAEPTVREQENDKDGEQ